MLSITNHQGSANQNHNDISPHNCWMVKSQEISVGKDESVGKEKREPLNTVGRNVNWYSYYGKQYGGSSKTQK